jgi:hypothetical protein
MTHAFFSLTTKRMVAGSSAHPWGNYQLWQQYGGSEWTLKDSPEFLKTQQKD